MVKNSSSSSKVLQAADGYIGVANNPHGSNIPPKLGSNGKRQYRGVRMRSWGSWVSEIRAPNQKTRIWLGSYSTPEAAARAYDAALLCVKGNSARLNFPAAPCIQLPDTTMSPRSIQRMAAAAAAAAAANATLPFPSPDTTPPSSPLDSFLPPSSDTSDDETSRTISPEEEGMLSGHFLMDPSINFEAFFQSPKCMDHMLNASAFFAPSQAEEWEDEGDITLWSFC
ncbi:hypothetical protein OPV22_024244 [Ensete ventricosum]|uniref:AP2/ERF domain-containing protein n=1 Tax=Ensete ventricosum TaxID=4639 RepID=A0AAV8QXE4_ENSVE|nr:hypothetical protein OPV22_024244 [Ensete ventricosum]